MAAIAISDSGRGPLRAGRSKPIGAAKPADFFSQTMSAFRRIETYQPPNKRAL
jgi:hypothetical protein